MGQPAVNWTYGSFVGAVDKLEVLNCAVTMEELAGTGQ